MNIFLLALANLIVVGICAATILYIWGPRVLLVIIGALSCQAAATFFFINGQVLLGVLCTALLMIQTILGTLWIVAEYEET